MLAPLVAVCVLIVLFAAVLAITHIHRKRRLPCRPDSADLQRRHRIRAEFRSDLKD